MRGSLGTANSRIEWHFPQVNVLETTYSYRTAAAAEFVGHTVLGGETHGRRDVAEDAISIGGVDLADPDTYVSGMPFEAFRKLRRRAPSHGTRIRRDPGSWR